MTDIAQLGLAIDSSGAASAATALNRLSTAASGASTATSQLTATAKPASAAAAALSSAVGMNTQALQALTLAVGGVQASMLNMGKAQTSVVSTTNNVNNSVNTTTATLKTAAVAHGAHTTSMVNGRMAAMEFEHVIRSMVDGLAAGADPMRLLMMEGGRLAQAFQASGGVGGALSMFGNFVSKLASPTILLTGAVAGLGAVGFSAFAGWENRLGALQVALNGVGRSTGLTLGALNRVAVGGAGGDVSVAQSQSAAATMASTGRIAPGTMGSMLGPNGLINQFSKATGTGYGEAAGTLSGYVADPTKGAEALNKQFGFLTDSTQRLIANLQSSGRMLEAQGVLIRATAQDLAGASDHTWTFEKIARGIATGASNALAATGNAVQRTIDPDVQQRYEAARSNYMRLQRRASADNRGLRSFAFGDSMSGVVEQTGAARNSEEDLNEQYRRQGQLASQRGRDAEAARQSQVAGDIVRQTVGELSARQALRNTRDSLSTALNAPGARGGLDADALREADEALGRLNARIDSFRTSAERAAEDSLLTAQALQSETAQERTALTALRAYTDVIRDSGDKALAAATAQGKWNEAIAESNKQASDALRGAQDKAGMLGLSPLGRSEREINLRFRDIRQNSVTGPVSGLTPDDDRRATALDTSAPSDLSLKMRRPLPMDDLLGTVSSLAVPKDFGSAPKLAGSGWPKDFWSLPKIAGGGWPKDFIVNPQQNSVTGPLSGLTPDDRRATALDTSAPSELALKMRRPVPMDDILGTASSLAVPKDFGSLPKIAGGGWPKDFIVNPPPLSHPVPPTRDTDPPAASDVYVGTSGSPALARNVAAARRLVPSGIQMPSSSAGSLNRAQGIEIGVARDQATNEVIRQTNEEIERNRQLLMARSGALGKDTFEVNKAVAAQELWNKLQLQDADIKRLGPQRMAAVTQAIDASANSQARLQQQQTEYQQKVQTIDQVNDLGKQFVGGAANDVFSTFNTNPNQLVGQLSTEDQAKFYSGQMSGRDVQSKLAGRQINDLIKNMLFQQGIGMIQKGLFGAGSSGSPGYQPGLLGGLASGLLGGITGGSGGGAAGGSGGFLSGISHLFGFADGGIMTSRGSMPLRRYEGGGVANSPQAAIFGEGKTPEAYVPLADGRTIPVSMKTPNLGGGRGGGQAIIVQGGDLHVHGNMDNPTTEMVQAMISQQTKQITDNLQKTVGNVQAKWNQFNGG